jgi:hypothetical protein
MKIPNSWLLAGVIALVFVPWSVLLLIPRSPAVAFVCGAIVGCIWLAVAVTYYRRVRTRSALLIFLLIPIAFGPAISFLLLFLAAWSGHFAP